MTTNTLPQTKNAIWFLEGLVEQHDSIQHIPINSVPFRIGRSHESGLCLPFPSVSNCHAEILLVDDKLLVHDLGSTNGTFLNGHRVKETAPIGEGDLLQFATIEFRIRQQPAREYQGTIHDSSYRKNGVLTRFEDLLAARGVTPKFQPIIEFEELFVVGYEVLARSALEGLENPDDMFLVAQRLGLASELSMMLRLEGVQAGTALPKSTNLFINTHPSESVNSGLLESMAKLRELFPERPLTLEIHEASVTDLKEMHEFQKKLTDLDVRLAYDDFGAGQTRLMDLVEVPPDYLKFDIKLVRDIHQNEDQQKMVASLVAMVKDFGIIALAEGIECLEEADVCKSLGFGHGQGYFFGKPAPINTDGLLATD